MSIYSGTDLENFIAQINQDNPELPWPVNATDFIFGKPTVIATPTDRRNTSIKVTPKSTSQYRGSLTLTYERLDLSKLFRSLTVSFTRWLNSNTYLTHAFIIPLLNQMYGLNLEVTKMTSNGGAGNIYTVSANSTTYGPFPVAPTADNLMYIGSVPVKWNRGLQEIGIDILTTSELVGETWPGGNDFVATPDRTMSQEFLFAGVDLTEWVSSNGLSGSIGTTTINNTAASQSLLAAINAQTGLNINTAPYDAATNPQGLGNASYTYVSVALPNAGFPYALKPGFSSGLILNLQSHPTFKGRPIAFYNV